MPSARFDPGGARNRRFESGNFADRPTDLEAIFAPETLERLREVKRRYDPDGLISGNHNISLG